jgi:hypothetical protein
MMAALWQVKIPGAESIPHGEGQGNLPELLIDGSLFPE